MTGKKNFLATDDFIAVKAQDGIREYAQNLKSRCLRDDTATVFTIGVRHQPRDLSVNECGRLKRFISTLFSPVCFCDYAFIVGKTNTGLGNLSLFKNRYGSEKCAAIEYVNNGKNLPVLRQIGG